MSNWNIQPQEVGGVLSTVAGHIGDEEGGDGLVGCMKKLEDRLVDIGESADSVVIDIALEEFAGHYFGVMSDMAALTVSAVQGTSDATTHYVNGNLEMAAESQANAGEVPEPDATPQPSPGQDVPV